MTTSIEPHCPDCGAPGVASPDDCKELFTEVGAREFADEAFFCVHRLTVDAYCLQHPDAYMRSSKSAAAHLAAMCWSMEYGRSANLPGALKRWVDGPRASARVPPPPPRQRGALTVRHVLGVEDPDEYAARAEEWARSAWEAWGEDMGGAGAGGARTYGSMARVGREAAEPDPTEAGMLKGPRPATVPAKAPPPAPPFGRCRSIWAGGRFLRANAVDPILELERRSA